MNRSWLPLIGESVRVAAATRVVAGLVWFLALIVPATVLGATGLNVEGQAAILRRVDDVGARTMTIVSTNGEAPIPAAAVERIAALGGVDWVLGLGPVFDVRHRAAGGGPTPLRAIRAVRAPVRFSATAGGSGAYLSRSSAERVGLAGAFGVLDPGAIDVVGWFSASSPLESLDAFILLPSDDDGLRLERIIVAVDDVGWVELVVGVLPAMVGTDAARTVTVERSPALLEAREAVRDEVVRRDRLFVVAILAVSTALSCVVVFAGTVAGRRDFGRRRALGATRGQLTVLVMLTTLWPALAGSAAGTLTGWLYLGSRLERPADWPFPVSVGVLAVLVLTAVSVIPATVAATRDPLRVLRVP